MVVFGAVLVFAPDRYEDLGLPLWVAVCWASPCW